MSAQKIRVFIADDHRMLRAGILALLEKMPDVLVVGESGDGLEALELIHQLQPDLVLLDLSMPRLDGLSILDQSVEKLPATRFVVLSMHSDMPYVARALKLGASAYLVKDSDAFELEIAIKAVMSGEVYLTSKVSRSLVDKALERQDSNTSRVKKLTTRQLEVLKLIAMGHTTKSIAKELNISLKTADTHRTQLMERLGIHEIAGLVRFAIREGIVNPNAEH